MSTELIHIEVACALPERQVVEAMSVVAGCTARAAVLQSGLAAEFPDLDFAQLALGIYSKAVTDDYVLQEGDRIELYRPLLLDPKEARRQRAAKAKQG
ncbi:MAG: RnfH family protein [Pseudomonadales bacterium]